MYRKVKTAMATFGCVTAAIALFAHSVSASTADGSVKASAVAESSSSGMDGAVLGSGADSDIKDSSVGFGTRENGTGSGTKEDGVGSGTGEGTAGPGTGNGSADFGTGGGSAGTGGGSAGTGGGSAGTESGSAGTGTEGGNTGTGAENGSVDAGTGGNSAEPGKKEKISRSAAELLEDVDWSEMAAAKVRNYVNIRKKASKKSDIVGILQKGHAVKVVKTKGSWTKIVSGKIKGYIKSEYLVFGKKARKLYMKNVGVTGTVTAKKLNIREEASRKAERLDSMKKGSQVTLKGQEGGWYEISYKKGSGYVAAKHVTVDKLQGAITLKAYQKSQEEEIGCSKRELDMLAAIIECEAGGEKREGKVAVGAVVLNRVKSKRFPNTIEKVIKQRGQFSPVRSGKFARVLARGARKDCYEAARAALRGENPVGNALFFSAGRGKGKQIGNQHFH